MIRCDQRQALKELQASLSNILDLAPKHQVSCLQTDFLATVLVPSDVQLDSFTAAKTTGDGSCLYNAVSLSLIGIVFEKNVLIPRQ